MNADFAQSGGILQVAVRVALLMVLCLAGVVPLEGAERPNVLLIVLDATRPDRLTPYGYGKDTSPHLDAIARDGLLYEQCISAASWTLPSFASIFTGKYVRDHGVSSQDLELSSSEKTLAEYLREAGYSTVGYSSNAWLGSFSNMDQGFDEYFDMWRGSTHSGPDDGAAVTNEWIGDWLDYSREEERPFFMFVLYFEPHFPYAPPPAFVERFLPEGAELSEVTRLRRWKHPREVGYILKAPEMEISPAEFEVLRALYDSEISYVDSRIGELMEAFRSRELLDDTIVVVTSDHGEHLGEHALMDHKMSLYDPVVRVPLILRYPRALPGGIRIPDQVQTVQILPTLLELTGIAQESSRAIPPLPRSPGGGMEFTYSEFRRPEMFLDVMTDAFPDADHRPFDRALKSVRSLQWKFIWASDGRHELYNLQSDPGESDNLYDSSPETAAAMRKILNEFETGNRP